MPLNESILLELLDNYGGWNGQLDFTLIPNLYKSFYSRPLLYTGKLKKVVERITDASPALDLKKRGSQYFLARKAAPISRPQDVPMSLTGQEPIQNLSNTSSKEKSCQTLSDINQLLDYIQTDTSVYIDMLKFQDTDGVSFVQFGFQLVGSDSKPLVFEYTIIDDDAVVGPLLGQIFNSGRQPQIYIHDCYRLKKYFTVKSSGQVHILDIQLAMEHLYDLPYNNSFEQVAAAVQMSNPKTDMGELLNFIFVVAHKIEDEIDSDILSLLHQASKDRISSNGTVHEITFNTAKDFAMSSKELLTLISPTDCYDITKPVIYNDVDDLLHLLPQGLQMQINDLGVSNLTEICMDYGRPAFCWVRGKRYFFESDVKVKQKGESNPDLISRLALGFFVQKTGCTGNKDNVESRVLQEETKGDANENYYITSKADLDAVVIGVTTFGFDNRSGLEKKLHRISCMRNREGNIFGLTLRVGRHIDGIASIVADLLFGQSKSVLVLGEPGSGKTTVIRDISRLLSQKFNVVIVDTSNEIGGDGDIPHSCIGNARRMMVTKLTEQSNVMIECVQNHTPHVMIIDEIGRPQEVEAARTCKQRGVRMISSAHGNLKTLMKNAHLKGLIGGIELVTVGDEEAKKGGSLNKLKAQRQGEPVFDVIIELTRENTNIWTVIPDTAKAVDSMLERKPYTVEIRSRDPLTNIFSMRLETLS